MNLVKSNKLRWILPAVLGLVLFNLGWIGITSASAAATILTTLVPTFQANAGNVNLGEIWILENEDQAKSGFTQSPPGPPIDITVTIITGGVRFQAIPDLNPGSGVVDVVDPLSTIANNTITANDLSLVGTASTQTYTLRVAPSYPPGSIRGGLQLKFPVCISCAPAGPIEIEISAPDTGITGGRFVAGEQYGISTPAPPKELSAEALSATEVEVMWSDTADNEEGFVIERKELETEYSLVGQVAANTIVYMDAGLHPNATYFYRVRAFNKSGNSDYSNECQVVTKNKILSKVICFLVGQPEYMINDQVKIMDTVPLILEDRTFLPVRYLAEALGAVVNYESEIKKATLTLGDTVIELWTGNQLALVNGKATAIDSQNPGLAPVIDNSSRMLLPVRFIAENLGCKVDWDTASREVRITLDREWTGNN